MRPEPYDDAVSVLSGLRVVEFDAIGPAPFCGKLLADHGASVIRIGRPGGQPNGLAAGGENLLIENRPTIELDLKSAEERALVRALVRQAHVLIEGYRPGVMERLGLGPEECWALNPALVYGRMTGYGQSGPLAAFAGHDINYIALTGLLQAVGDPETPPTPPLNLAGDFGGGGMVLAFGVLAARLRSMSTGRGEVVDAAMVDGTVQLMGMIYGLRNVGRWSDARGSNSLDGGAPFYRCYRTRDGRFVAIGALEGRFYQAMLHALGVADEPLFDEQWDRSRWPAMRGRLERIIAERTLAQWCVAFQDPNACISPVLKFDELSDHPHLRARASMTRSAAGSGRERLDYRPAPRFFDTGAAARGSSRRSILDEWALEEEHRHAVEKRLLV